MTAHSSKPGARLAVGHQLPFGMFTTMHGSLVTIGSDPRPVHIQFRRFAGCPVCSLHLRSFVRRRHEIDRAVREIVLFHSSRDELQRHAADLPFAVIADPDKQIYAAFGVEADPRALSDPRAWRTIIKAVLAALPAVLIGRKPLPPLVPEGGRFGLPADFLVAADGRILALKYGEHADDQWSVDDVLSLAERLAPRTQAAATKA